MFAIDTRVGNEVTGLSGARGYGFVVRGGDGFFYLLTDYHLAASALTLKDYRVGDTPWQVCDLQLGSVHS